MDLFNWLDIELLEEWKWSNFLYWFYLYELVLVEFWFWLWFVEFWGVDVVVLGCSYFDIETVWFFTRLLLFVFDRVRETFSLFDDEHRLFFGFIDILFLKIFEKILRESFASSCRRYPSFNFTIKHKAIICLIFW